MGQFLELGTLHLVKASDNPRLVSGSKDGTVKVWDTTARTCAMTLSSHTGAVSCVKWSGSNIVYSASHDKTIKAWDISANGKCIQTLKSHAHWVNHLSLSTDYVLRKGGFDHTSTRTTQISPEELRARALQQYEKVAKLNGSISERLVTASDDFTMYFWEPLKSSKPICRMTGHQNLSIMLISHLMEDLLFQVLLIILLNFGMVLEVHLFLHFEVMLLQFIKLLGPLIIVYW